jgi:excinuclease ABC subunit C
LDNIKGIGPKTREELLSSLKTVKRISEAEMETLTAIVGQTKAQLIYEHFRNHEQP